MQFIQDLFTTRTTRPSFPVDIDNIVNRNFLILRISQLITQLSWSFWDFSWLILRFSNYSTRALCVLDCWLKLESVSFPYKSTSQLQYLILPIFFLNRIFGIRSRNLNACELPLNVRLCISFPISSVGTTGALNDDIREWKVWTKTVMSARFMKFLCILTF